MVPMYLPLNRDEPQITSKAPIFFPAINLYLKEKFPFLDKSLPRWLEWIFNTTPLLELASSLSGSTNPKEMGPTTLSLLRGEAGGQKKELHKLISWLRKDIKPDIVHLSNGLLLGLAPALKKELNCRVFCSLQDEDTWLEAMTPSDTAKAKALMTAACASVNRFITFSRYYRNFMANYMGISARKISIIPLGIHCEAYWLSRQSFQKKSSDLTIGYLSRMSPGLGLDLLVDAFIKLHQRGHRHLRLLAYGGQIGQDRRFVKQQIKKLKKAKLRAKAEIVRDYFSQDIASYIAQMDLLSVPIPQGRSFWHLSN